MFGFVIGNNCDEESESETVRAKRYKKCDIIFGEAGYYQRDIILS
jgi:hypothetical protein